MSNYILKMLLLPIIGLAACSPTTANVAGVPSEESGAVFQNEPEHDEENGELHDEPDESGQEHEEDEHREHGPHEHGSATLSVAWSGNEIEIDLDTPGFNLFGFEHEPSTGEDRQVVATALQDLKSGDLLNLNSEAMCQVDDATITTELNHEDEDGEADLEETEHEEVGEAHSDVEAEFSLVCGSPEAIRTLDLNALFDRFPNFETLTVQWVSDTSQSAAELTGESPILSFQP